jgi:hypothetical protein
LSWQPRWANLYTVKIKVRAEQEAVKRNLYSVKIT